MSDPINHFASVHGGMGHIRTAISITNLGEAYENQCKYDDANSHCKYDEAIELCEREEKAFGADGRPGRSAASAMRTSVRVGMMLSQKYEQG